MLGWYVITGLNDPGVWFGCWEDAENYLHELDSRDARIIGPGCDPEGGDSIVAIVAAVVYQ